MSTVNNLTGVRQSTPSPDTVTGLIECKWPASYTLTVPTTWVSGMYLARLTGLQSGKQSYITFVVRDDNRASDLLFESSVTTFQAYNFWPGGANGRSLYDFTPGERAEKVSFNRPYGLGLSYTSSTPGAASGVGAGEFLTNLQPGPAQDLPIHNAGWEYNMVRWLEKNGYDITYFTDIDLHENGALLNNHKAYLSVGHNEYWSMQMRQNVQTALNNGKHLGFFSANTMYWQVRFEPASNGAADRTMVCYKYDAPTDDPLYNSNSQLSTVRFRDPHVNLPEAALIGTEYVADSYESDIVISNASHSLMSGTGLKNGDHLAGMLGYELDVMVPGTSPSNTQVLTSSPFPPLDDIDNPPGFSCDTQTCNSNATWYSKGRGFVFSAGSMEWSWGLDDYNAPSLRPAYANSAAQKLTANVLATFIAGTSGGGILPLGGVVASDPSCASANDGTSQIICAVRGTDNAVYAIRLDPSTGFSTGYQSLGGVIAGNPSCASPGDGSGQVTCAVKGTDNAVYAIRFNPATNFSTGYQTLLGRVITGDPSCAGPNDGTGQVICGVQGTDNALYAIRFNPATNFSTGYQTLGGLIATSPSCATSAGGQVTCGVRGTDNQLYAIRFNPATSFSSGYQSLGGALAGVPSCAGPSDSSGKVICASRGTNNSLRDIGLDPGSNFNTAFQNLGGVMAGNPGCAISGSGQASCVVRGTDSQLYGIGFNPAANTNTGFQGLGGSIGGNPSCASAGTGRISCVAKGTDNSLYGVSFPQ